MGLSNVVQAVITDSMLMKSVNFVTVKTLPHIIKRAHFAVRHVMDSGLAKHGLTHSQFDVMMRIAESDCPEHRALLKDMEIASPTLTKLVNSLEDSGFITRVVSKEDARVKVLKLTDKGKSVQTQLVDTYPALLERFFNGFSPAEQAVLADLLERLIENAEATEAESLLNES